MSPQTWRFGRRGETAVTVTGPVRANSGEALRDGAIAGLGLVQLPLFIVAPAIGTGQLRVVLEDHPAPEAFIYALHSPGRVPAKVRSFVDFLAGRFGPRPSWERVLIRSRGRRPSG
jgi:DNA-binding transcriptional LysR family regulator